MSTRSGESVSTSINESLYDAAEEGSLEKLNEAVANGADIHYLSPKRLCVNGSTGNSALHVACYKGLRPVIDRLLELGADIHLKTTEVTISIVLSVNFKLNLYTAYM